MSRQPTSSVNVMFLVDTSGSMGQRCGKGVTFLDVARDLISYFQSQAAIKAAQTQMNYFLITFDDDVMDAVKVTTKDPATKMKEELGKLKASDLTNVGAALRNSFDLLNFSRFQTGIDTYGLGRQPWFIEPTMVIVFTDGGPIVTETVVADHVSWPAGSQPGAELSLEPFRWDQRLFSLTLRMPAAPPTTKEPEILNNDEPLYPTIYSKETDPLIKPSCEAMGGQSFNVYSVKEGENIMDHLIKTSKQTGVVISLEKMDGEPQKENSLSPRLEPNCAQNIFMYVPLNYPGIANVWPLPEPFWIDPSTQELPPRSKSVNTIYFSTNPTVWMVEEGMFDKYRLSDCALTAAILKGKNPDQAYQVFMPNSHRQKGRGYPFGFMKPSSQNNAVNLFVMPYNYPALFQLIGDLKKNSNPTTRWRQDFETYLHEIPYYYIPPLRQRLQRFGADRFMPAQLTGSMPFSVQTQLKHTKQVMATEADKFYLNLMNRKKQKEIEEKAALNKKRGISELDSQWGSQNHEKSAILAKNPFDVNRDSLLDAYYKMSAQFFAAADGCKILEDEDIEHSVLVSEMGAFSTAYEARLAQVERAKFRKIEFEEPPASKYMSNFDETRPELESGAKTGKTRDQRRLRRLSITGSKSPSPSSTPPMPSPALISSSHHPPLPDVDLLDPLLEENSNLFRDLATKLGNNGADDKVGGVSVDSKRKSSLDKERGEGQPSVIVSSNWNFTNRQQNNDNNNNNNNNDNKTASTSTSTTNTNTNTNTTNETYNLNNINNNKLQKTSSGNNNNNKKNRSTPTKTRPTSNNNNDNNNNLALSNAWSKMMFGSPETKPTNADTNSIPEINLEEGNNPGEIQTQGKSSGKSSRKSSGKIPELLSSSKIQTSPSALCIIKIVNHKLRGVREEKDVQKIIELGLGIMKEIWTPGKNITKLRQFVSRLPSDRDVKKSIIRRALQEAQRYKKRLVVSFLREQLQLK